MQVIRVKYLVVLLALKLLGHFLGSEEPLLMLLVSWKLQRTNSKPISNCWSLKMAIFILCSIKCDINSLLQLRVRTRII